MVKSREQPTVQLLPADRPKHSTLNRIISSLKGFNTKSFVNRLFPLTLWIPQYNLEKFRGDLIAGLTVGIMIIPQSIAFAAVAGLPPEYGLYAALTPGITYCFLGTSKDVSIGPAVTMGLFTYRFNSTYHPIGASTLAFFVGLILMAMSVLRLGFVTKFIPSHVISGFVSAAAIVIGTTQLKSLFGYQSDASTFVDKVIGFFEHVKDSNPWDISLGAFSVVFLATFMILSKTVLKRPSDNKASMSKKVGLQVLKFFCVARSALVCVICTVVAFAFHACGYMKSFTLTGILPKGLPKVQIPLQSVKLPTNQTVTTTDFLDEFGVSLIVLPLIQFIQNISVAKAFGKIYKYDVRSTQELIALGAANFVGSFFGGWPVAGSFSRSAVNAMSGTRTPFSGVISSVIVILAVSFLTPAFFYIPKTALAAMIMMAVVTMVEFDVPRHIWKVSKIDLLPYLITFFGTFYQLEMGVLVGAGVSLLIMVSREMRPKFDTNIQDSAIAHITLKGNLSYPAVDILKSRILKLLIANPDLKAVYVNMYAIQHVDYGVVVGVKDILQYVSSDGIIIEFQNFSRHEIRRAFQEGGILKSDPATSASDIPMRTFDEHLFEERFKHDISHRSSVEPNKLLRNTSSFISDIQINIDVGKTITTTVEQNDQEEHVDGQIDVELSDFDLNTKPVGNKEQEDQNANNVNLL